jgi:uncharacterized protein YbjT (DUF2867 family)
VARVLIVGCGCRGRELAATLLASGHAVRGTTRDPGSLAAIEATGAQAVQADPDLLATLTPHIAGISVLCWLMGSAAGEPEAVAALHGPRLESLLAALVDTPVRGVVYEGRGSVPGPLLEEGAAAVRRAGETFRMPVAVVDRDPSDHASWAADMARAVEEVLTV